MKQDAEYVKYINEHINWTAENTIAIGYQEQLVLIKLPLIGPLLTGLPHFAIF